MSIDEAVRILTLFNLWRRGDDLEPMQHPKVIGIALDVAITNLSALSDVHKDAERYKKLRKLNARLFADIFIENFKGKNNFDAIVDMLEK